MPSDVGSRDWGGEVRTGARPWGGGHCAGPGCQGWGLDEGGGGGGRGENRVDLEYVSEVVPLLGWTQRKAAGLRLVTLNPLPDAPVLVGGGRRGQVLLERGWAGAGLQVPPPPHQLPRLPLRPVSGRQLQAKKRKW